MDDEKFRYVNGGDNALLKLALYDVYKTKCYSCGVPQADFGAVQIDHIVPQTVPNDELTKWLSNEQIVDFDMHAPANLAPICPPCNTRKSNHDLSAFVQTALAQRKARQVASAVKKRVKFFRDSSAVAKFLITVADMDLEDPAVKATFVENMPALVRKLALLDPDKAQDFSEVRTVWAGDAAQGEPEMVTVTLDEAGRRALTVLEDVLEFELSDALQTPMSAVIAEVARQAERDLEAYEFDDRCETPTVGPATGTTKINVDEINIERSAITLFWFRFSGQLMASLSSSISVATVDGAETDEMQGDVFGSGTFTAEVGWELGDDEPLAGDVFVEDWQSDTSIW